MAARDFDGLIKGIVHHQWFSMMATEYAPQIDDLVAMLAATDVDLLIEKMYRQNLAMGSRLLLLARANIERSLLSGTIHASEREKLAAQIEIWERGVNHFNNLAQKFLNVRKALQTSKGTSGIPPMNDPLPVGTGSCDHWHRMRVSDGTPPPHT